MDWDTIQIHYKQSPRFLNSCLKIQIYAHLRSFPIFPFRFDLPTVSKQFDKHPDCAAVPPFEVMRKTLRDPLRSSTRLAGESLQITGCGGICKKWLLFQLPNHQFYTYFGKTTKSWIVKRCIVKPNSLVQLMQCFWLDDTDKICCMMMRKSPQGKQRI